MKKVLSSLLLCAFMLGVGLSDYNYGELTGSTGTMSQYIIYAIGTSDIIEPVAGVSAEIAKHSQIGITIREEITEIVGASYSEIMFTTDSTDIRKGPGTDYGIYKNVPINYEVSVIGEIDDWKICDGDTEIYYIHESSLSSEKTIIKTYTQKELEVLAHILYAEAGAESDTALYYVGSVVLNRVADKRYPNNIIDVVYEGNGSQYSPAKNNRFMKKKPSHRCYEIAEDLLLNGSVLPQHILGQASKSIANRYGNIYTVVDEIYFFSLKH